MKKAIIIGAGPAGLTAAYYLLKNTDIHPIILEQEDFVGGISRTVNYKGNRMDIGGHRFFSKNQEVVKLWKELLPLQGAPALDDKLLERESKLEENGPNPEREDEVLLNRNRVSRILYRRKFFSYPVSLSMQTIQNLGIGNMVEIGISFVLSQMLQRKERNLEDFMVNRFGRKLYQTFFRDYTHKVWGRYPKDIDADWGSQRIKGLSLSKALMDFARKAMGQKEGTGETSLIERFYYPKLGPGQLWEKLRSEVERMGGEIHFHAKVVGIQMDNAHHVQGVQVEEDGIERSLEGDVFFSSMPVSELVGGMPASLVQESVRRTAMGLPYRDFITVGLLVDKMKLKNQTKIRTFNGNVPDCWIYVQEPEVKVGRLQIFNNWSPYMVKSPKDTVWIGMEYFCQEHDEMWERTDSDMIRFAIEELASIDVIASEDVRESTVVRVPKAYPAYFDSYKEFPKVQEFLEGVENLYCIGRNGQHRYNNMDHSMLSAMEAVQCIKDGNKHRHRVWMVNAEKEYHEEK